MFQLIDNLLGGVFDGYNVSDLFRYEIKPVAENYPWNYETKQWNWDSGEIDRTWRNLNYSQE